MIACQLLPGPLCCFRRCIIKQRCVCRLVVLRLLPLAVAAACCRAPAAAASPAHPLRRAGGEERQHEREAGYEEARQRVDDRDLLEDQRGVVEGGQEADVAVADLGCVVHKQVREAIREVPGGRRGVCGSVSSA